MRTFNELKKRAWAANMLLPRHRLVTLTWGNVSELDPARGVFAIKPSGVEYDDLTPARMVVVNLEGKVVDGDHRPSSDTLSHLELYRLFPQLGGIVHAHSTHATAFAQAGRDIPCLGTTHADVFYGAIPVTRPLTRQEIRGCYEKAIGEVIVECFHKRKLNPEHIPGVLVHAHGPFTWGTDARHAVENAIVLESVAEMALLTGCLSGKIRPIAAHLLDKHFLRKHGGNAYYGQNVRPGALPPSLPSRKAR